MSSWNDTSRALPLEHEYVRFIVSGHRRPLLGVYENHSFRARWGAYHETQVGTWHKVGSAPHVPSPQHMQPEHATWSERPMREG